MAYDPGSSAEGSIAGTVVMFGGLAPWGPTNFTYVGIPATVPLPDEQPTSSVVWVNITTYLLRAPSARYYSSMTYDAHDGYLLLFGGESAGIGATLGDTWTLSVVYQGETVNPPPQPVLYKFLLFGWSPVVGGNHPPSRAGASLTYDSVDGYPVLFGGYNDPTYYGDTWTYSSGTWVEIYPTLSPYPRGFAGFVWDQDLGYALLLPGLGGSTDTWAFVHGTWTRLNTTTPLGARWGEGIAYDNATGNVSIFGGVNSSTMDTYSDTWNWSAPPGPWLQVDSYGPVARGAVAMTYDPQIGCSVLFGGGTSGGGGWTNDTWLLCTWPLSIAPFTVALLAEPGVSDRPEVHAGGNATFTAVPSGGIWPYDFEFNLYDGPGYPESQNLVFSEAPASTMFIFPSSANYFVSVTVFDSDGATAQTNLTYPVGTVMVTDWQPLRDSYAFHNFGSAWATGGNCFGVSTTELLYWQHDIRGAGETPYLPSAVWSTANLTVGAPVEPQDGPGMDGTTLAIMLHQTMVQGVTHLGGGGGTLPSEFAANWASIESSLAAGQPVVMILNAPSASHAVVAYGEETLPSGVVEIDVSDPNAPQTTEQGFYNASNDSFWWTGPAPVPNFDQFGVISTPVPSTLAPYMFSKWTQGNSNDYDTQSHGYYFVAGLAPLTVAVSGGGTDSFSDGGTLADSQTFVQGIANSSGVEEPSAAGTVQAFALENLTGNTYTVTDPASGGSPVLALLATNVSGTTMVRGFNLNLSSEDQHDFSLRLGAGGTVLRIGDASATVNISFGQLVGNTSDSLNATDLAFPGNSTVAFSVLNWSALASGTAPAVQVRVTVDNGTGPTTQYTLTNGQTGLGTGTTVSYAVTLEESGLPAGTPWSVSMNGTTVQSSGSSIVFNETNGTYSYTAATAGRRWATPPGSVTVTGASVSVPVPFHLVSYAVTFVERGLPTKLLGRYGWTVTLNGTTEHGLGATLSVSGTPNGTIPVLVTGPAGYVSSSSGSVNVSGNTSVAVGFARGHTVTLRFVERGLPRGQAWAITVDGARIVQDEPTIVFANLTPGTFGYVVASPLANQTITVKEGRATFPLAGSLDVTRSTTVSVTFAYAYAVTFTETGLTGGTWSVTIKGHTETAAWDRTIEVNLTNGTHVYRIGAEAGYKSVGTPSKATVMGAATSVTVTFTKKS